MTHQQKTQVISSRKIIRSEESNAQFNSTRPISRDSRVRSGQQVNNFFNMQSSTCTATDNRIPQRSSMAHTQATVQPSTLTGGTVPDNQFALRQSGGEVMRISDLVTNGSQEVRPAVVSPED